nr:alpha/beta fold hydrolase [Salsipaludibacter albus]
MFPRLHARSQRFTLGRPRDVTVSPDGERVWFLSSAAGDDPVHHLFLHTPTDGATIRLVDAGGADGELTDAERARRERTREGGGGIVAYDTDRAGRRAAFVLGGTVEVVDADGGRLVVATDGPMFDPRLAPDGRRLAGVVDGAVHVALLPDDLATAGPVHAHRLVGPGDDESDVTWGLAEFVAAEEMNRGRGFWFAGDGAAMLVARVDESPVATVHLADLVDPDRLPRPHRYPFAGTANADVTLHLLRLATAPGGDTPVRVVDDRLVAPPDDLDAEYLVDVTWETGRPALVTWQDRPQTRMVTVALDDDATSRVVADVQGRPWVEPVPGAPCWAGDRVVTVADRMDLGDEGTRAVLVDGEVVSPAGLQVRAVLDADDERVVVRASRGDATSIGVYAVDLGDGAVGEVLAGPGLHHLHLGGPTRVEVSTTLSTAPTTTVVRGDDRTVLPDTGLDPGLDVDVTLRHVTPRGLACGLLLPDGDGPFPVLVDPYGGPHSQRVLQARNAWLVPAWFASQGFAVLVTDNRGSPGRSPAFEHAIRDDMAAVVLADQVAALDAVAAEEPRLDLDRVAIRGWSYGGFLAGLAALRRPDRFRAAIVGAPVTEQRLYDTHYTERYLGHPAEAPDAYTASSLVDPAGELVEAMPTDEPADMLVIHGLVDDNVLVAHSLRLSRALLAAGRPHRFLPLSGVTHMTPQEVVAANILLLQVDFLRTRLGPT